MKSLNKTKFVLAVMILTSSAAMIIARANKMSRENIPLDFIISEWQLVIDPDAGNTRIDSSATVLSGSKHAPTEIPVAPSSIVLGDTKINGKKIVPRIKNGWFVVPVERDGLFTITADIKIKPTEDRGEKNITLAKPQSVVSLVRFDCDDAFEVRIKGERNILEGTETSGTHGEIFFSDKKDLSVTWREARKPADRQSILRVKPSVAWTVREKHLSATAVLDINISEKKLNDLAVNIPEGAENVFAAGRDIKEFKHAGKLVRIYFRGPIEGRTEIRLSFDIPRTKGSVVSCKDITAQNGIAETGGYILLLNDTHELMLENSIAGLKPISYYHLEDRMKGLVEGTPLFVYERQARDITAKFDMIAHSPFPMVGTVAL